MIDYKKIAESIDFYTQKGFQRIESPWTVTEEIDNITKPADRIHMKLVHNGKCLVASGEQSFLYLYCKSYLPLGKFQTVTPCFRYENYDGFHMKNFIKNELIVTDDVSSDMLTNVIDCATEFFSKYLKVEVVKTDAGWDIVSSTGVELGSYGIRTCDYISWIYGTGLAEPRLSRVIKQIENMKKVSYGVS